VEDPGQIELKISISSSLCLGEGSELRYNQGFYPLTSPQLLGSYILKEVTSCISQSYSAKKVTWLLPINESSSHAPYPTQLRAEHIVFDLDCI
jgi:hypothetical protein